MILAQISHEEWMKDYAKDAHKSVFGDDFEDFDKTLFDYALLVIDKESNTPIVYMTVRVLNKKSVFIEYGGSFPAFRGNHKVRAALAFILDNMRDKLGIETVGFLTAQKNIKMQKMGLATGFLVTGLTMGRYGLCLEYRRNFKGE